MRTKRDETGEICCCVGFGGAKLQRGSIDVQLSTPLDVLPTSTVCQCHNPSTLSHISLSSDRSAFLFLCFAACLVQSRDCSRCRSTSTGMREQHGKRPLVT